MGRIRDITVITAATATLVLGLTGGTLASEGGAHGGARSAGSASALTKAVSYLGYQVKVPASWPVYRLAADRSRCVLFNRHAVYLGSPGADQRCPSSALGRTEALLVQPLGSQASLPPHTPVQQGKTVEMPSGKQAAQDAASQTLRFALPTAGVQVTASYGHDPSLIRRILRGAQLTSAGPDRHGHAASHHGHAAGHSPARHHTRSGHRGDGNRHGQARPSVAGPARPAKPTRSPQAAAETSSSTSLSSVTGSGLGFDTCTVPSESTMKSWLASPFRMVGTYLGGDNWACGYGNFSRSWVDDVAAMGWRFIPLWVGPQAPCTSISGAATINPSQANSEGKSQAASAVSTASGFGFGKGSPIYFDMEGYDNQNRSCSSAVLSFLSGWSWGVRKAGYRAGVYSSASSGVADLAGRYGQSGFTEPNDIWYAQWDSDAVVTDGGFPGADWPGYERVHQFHGPNVEEFGGVKVNIDEDFVAGDVAGPSTPPGAYVLGQPDIAHVSPGASGQAQLVITEPAGRGGSQTVGWKIQQGDGVSVTPDRGSAVVAPGESVTIGLDVKASSSASSGRYNLAVSAESGGQPLSGTTLLVTVARHTLSTPEPVVMYAADHASMQAAEQVAGELALPSGSLVGNLGTAWRDVTSGKSIVLAVGQAALNGLYRNPCGWANPAHMKAGSTPFIDLGGPLDHPPGKIYFENAAGAGLGQTVQITDALLKYALTGTLPSPHAMPAAPAMPTSACIG